MTTISIVYKMRAKCCGSSSYLWSFFHVPIFLLSPIHLISDMVKGNDVSGPILIQKQYMKDSMEHLISYCTRWEKNIVKILLIYEARSI